MVEHQEPAFCRRGVDTLRVEAVPLVGGNMGEEHPLGAVGKLRSGTAQVSWLEEVAGRSDRAVLPAAGGCGGGNMPGRGGVDSQV